MRHLQAALAIFCLPAAASALTLGAPVFSTAPGDVSFVAEFFENAPSGVITISTTPDAVIASAFGAPALVGQSLRFSFTGFQNSDGTFDDNTNEFFPDSAFFIGDADFIFLGEVDDSTFFVLPPHTETEDPVTGVSTLVYNDPFGVFGGPFTEPFPGTVPFVKLFFTIDQPLPEFNFRIYCFLDDPQECTNVEQDGDIPLTEIDGRRVVVDFFEVYQDGPFAQPATLTFYTVDGLPIRDLAPVPLPAAAWLLGSALFGLGAMRHASGRRSA